MTATLPLLLGILANALPGADWPEFRGAGAAGVAPGRFPAQDGNFPAPDWTVPVPGQGWSSPVVRDGLLVLTAAVPEGDPARQWSFVVLGLDPATGKPRFRTTVFERPADSLPKIHSKNSHASPTPVLTKRGIVVHFGHVGTALVDNLGKVLWRTEGLYSKPVHGGGASPVVVAGKVLIPCDGLDLQALVALDLEKGKEAWRLDRKAGASKTFSFSTPCPNGENNG
ncbi:MAG: PQQ-binding-like beta-propeller repeat protein, partial [Gemmataceae bacterium]